MKNKRIILVATMSVVSLISLDAKSNSNNYYFGNIKNNYYIEIGGGITFYDSPLNRYFKDSSENKDSSKILNHGAFSIGVGYNAKFDNNVMFGAGLSYIYSSNEHKNNHGNIINVALSDYYNKYRNNNTENEGTTDEGIAIGRGISNFETDYINVHKPFYTELFNNLLLIQSENINSHRINLDVNVGYSFKDKIALSFGGIISYNSKEPKNISFPIMNNLYGFDAKFNKKITDDLGLGFSVGLDVRLIKNFSWNTSYRMVWFNTTKDYKDFINNGIKSIETFTDLSFLKISDTIIDAMIITGIRYNF